MRLCLIPCFGFLVVGAACLEAADAPKVAEIAVPAVAPLTKTEMEQAATSDDLTLPVPGEFFAAIGKRNRPNWSLFYRHPPPSTFENRAQIALNLGGLIADGYIAVEAQDSQQVKNIGKDIIAMARALGVSQKVLGRGNSITDFAENNEWNALKEELEATQNDVRSAMAAMEDQDLVILVNLGGWIRGTEVVTSVIAQNYDPSDARLLRQPAVLGYLGKQLDLLPQSLQEEPLIRDLKKKLREIRDLVDFPADHIPTAEEILSLRKVVGSLMPLITTPAKPK